MLVSFIVHSLVAIFLTLVSFVGGAAWLLSLFFTGWGRFFVFVATYGALSLGFLWFSPMWGLSALPCAGDGPLRSQSVFYCATNRQFVSIETARVVQNLAEHVAREYPGTLTLALDGGFPLANGFPLLPHLSHSDGRKLDLAFYYRRGGSYARGETKSPIGYFAFEDGPTDCKSARFSLRWDLDWLQGYWKKLELDEGRMRTAVLWLSQHPSIEKIFLEPHLTSALRLRHPKVRFQGCRAARHDDHIHIQLK